VTDDSVLDAGPVAAGAAVTAVVGLGVALAGGRPDGALVGAVPGGAVAAVATDRNVAADTFAAATAGLLALPAPAVAILAGALSLPTAVTAVRPAARSGVLVSVGLVAVLLAAAAGWVASMILWYAGAGTSVEPP
jgi:hypothetical protein